MRAAEPELPMPIVLLIENDESDVFLVRRALGKADWRGELRVVGSISEARAYVENTFPFENKAYFRRPDLIISDYKLNSQTALDFLLWLQSMPAYSNIPVVVLSGVRSHIPPEHLSLMKVSAFLLKNPDVSKLADLLKPFLPTQ